MKWDLLAFGALAVDEMLYVDAFPEPDTKTEVRAHEREFGGLGGVVAITAARMGLKSAYCGVLGDDELSAFCRVALDSEGIDLTPLLTEPDARPFHSFVVADAVRGGRTIFYSAQGVLEPPGEAITPALIGESRVVFVDHTSPNASLKAARLARELGRPVVGDVERTSSDGIPFLELVDHLIVSYGFGRGISGSSEPAEIVRLLRTASRTLTAVTVGERGCWWAGGDGVVHHQPAFHVPVVNTVGCGDVFHGAYAVAISERQPLADAVRFASAAAAVKAAHHAGREGIPDRRQVEQLLKKSGVT